MSAAVTKYNCAGSCCRNPWGVCSHKRDCVHHLAEIEAQHKAEAHREWIELMTRGKR